jgi:serralysin
MSSPLVIDVSGMGYGGQAVFLGMTFSSIEIAEINGGTANDTIVASSATNYGIRSLIADGGGGNDNIVGSGYNDIIYGGDGNDTLSGFQNGFHLGGQDLLDGGAGDDIISGGNGKDILIGGTGNDRLILGFDASGSSIDGGADRDTLVVNSNVFSLTSIVGIEAVELVGGANLTLTGTQIDTGLSYFTTVSGQGSITVNMDAAPSGYNLVFTTLYTFAGPEVSMVINGTTGINVIKLGASLNTVNGGASVDQIRGGSLVDIINGNEGGDKIWGLGGADIITTGSGNDQLRYARASESGLGALADVITDFSIGSDRLVFVQIDADAATAGDQAFSFVGTGAFTATGTGQIRYGTSGSDIIVQADVNGDGNADMEIILQGLNGQTLTAADFVL